MKKVILGIVVVLVVVGVVGGIKGWQFSALIAAGKNFKPQPETVAAAVVREEKWQGTLSAIGGAAATIRL